MKRATSRGGCRDGPTAVPSAGISPYYSEIPCELLFLNTVERLFLLSVFFFFLLRLFALTIFLIDALKTHTTRERKVLPALRA